MSRHIPYFDFYPADFMNGVRGLSPQEVGVYTMLLCRIYEESGPIEFHVERLSTYCGMRSATFEKVAMRLVDLGKFSLVDGALSNRRAEIEIQSRADKLKINSKAGKASAEKRQQKQSEIPSVVQRPFNHTDTDTEATLSSVADAAPRDDLDALRDRLLAAVGEDNIQGHGAFDLSTILGLIGAGVSVEIDIIPTLKAKRSRMRFPARSWAFFEAAIREAYERRVGASKAISAPADDLKAGTLMRHEGKLVPTTEARWQKRVDAWRGGTEWSRSEWGPPPGEAGCSAPQHLLQTRQEAA